LADKILVMGGTGFFGRAVTHMLIDAGYEVRMLVRDPGRAGAMRVRGAELVTGDATDEAVLAGACKGVKAVVDLVAVRRNRPQGFFEINVEGPAKLGKAAKEAGVLKVVFVSAVGAGPTAPSTYLQTRYAGEQALTRTGVPRVILRFSVILGEDGGLADAFERQANFGPYIVVPGDGKQHFQPIVREDAARCVIEALGRSDLLDELEIGGPEILTLEQLLDFFCQARGITKRKLHVPIPLLMPGATVMEIVQNDPVVVPDELRGLSIDNIAKGLDVVVSTFGWQPQSPSAWASTHWRAPGGGAVRPHAQL
jgi:uncharacterized protein YbjT (DUF2867 family)